MDIYQRFKALPRGRKGSTTVVIVEETVLAELIAAAQTPGARLFGAQHVTAGSIHFSVDPPPGLGALADVVRVIEDSRPTRRRRGW